MKIKFLKETKDIRKGRKGIFRKGTEAVVYDDLGKKYIDSSSAIDLNGKYKKKIEKDG